MPPFDRERFKREVKRAMHDDLKKQIGQRLLKARPILDSVNCPVHGIGSFKAEVVDKGLLKLAISFDGCCEAGERAAGERVRLLIE